MAGSAYLQQAAIPMRLVARMRCHISGVACVIGPTGAPTAAMLARMSSRPNVSTAAGITRAASASCAWSAVSPSSRSAPKAHAVQGLLQVLGLAVDQHDDSALLPEQGGGRLADATTPPVTTATLPSSRPVTVGLPVAIASTWAPSLRRTL